MGVFTQYNALLKKNFILKRRSWAATLFELCLPALIFLVLVIIKELLPPKDHAPSLHMDQEIVFDQSSRITSLSQSLIENNAKIAFYPPTESAPLRQYMIEMGFAEDGFKLFNDGGELKKWINRDLYASGLPNAPDNIHCAIEVLNLDGPAYQYSLRFNATGSDNDMGALDPHDTAAHFFQHDYTTTWNTYDRQGFMLMQDIIDTFILTKEGAYTWPSGETPVAHDNSFKKTFLPMPTLRYHEDSFSSIVGSFLGSVLTLIFIWPLTRIISSLVEEKELKLKASMQLMGLGTASLFLSWLTLYVIIFAIISFLLCLCSFWGIYSNSFIIIIFFIYWFFGLTVFSVAYLLSAFFDNSKTAAAFGSITFLLTSFVSFGTADASSGAQTNACLIPTVCLTQIASTISQLEASGVGLTTTTVSESFEDKMPVSTGLLMLLLDFFIYLILGLYFNQVTRSNFGISQPWYFPIKSSFWCGTKYSRKGSPCGCFFKEYPSNLSLDIFDPLTTNESFTQIEPPLSNDEPVIQVRDLRKTYPGTSGRKKNCCQYEDFVALKGTSLDMYKGQIFVILGENGAGKSTLFNMLTGLIPPTSGEALLNGFSIKDDITQVYAQQGVCFQHDVLYPNLTVKEHMYLFAAVKQMDMNNVDDEINGLLDTVGLGPKGDNKLNSLSSTLSGGQKRKLSVAISLLNNPKVLFLDELSTGVDPASRRILNKVLLEARKDRVIVMTTHDMDEASSIGDRLAIIAAGKLMCSGSNLFLKDKYGVGYTLLINKVTDGTGNDGSKVDNGDCDVENMTSAIQLTETSSPLSQQQQQQQQQQHLINDPNNTKAVITTPSGQLIYDYITTKFPFAMLSGDNAGEISFKLPLSAADQFPLMLDSLDRDQHCLGISTYGLGVTSLTEVFLKVIEGQSREDLYHEDDDEERTLLDQNGQNDHIGQNNTNIGKNAYDSNIDDTWGSTANNITTLSASYIFWRHFKALFIKRWYNFRRDGRAALWTLLYPGILLLAGLFAMQSASSNNFGSRVMSADLYGKWSPQLVLGNPTTTDMNIVEINDALSTIAPAYSHVTIPTTTTDITSEGTQQWLQDEYNLRPFKTARFGGVLITEAGNIPTTDPTLPPSLSYSLHINSTAPDSLPIYSNYINNAILQMANPEASIELKNAPLPKTKKYLSLMTSGTALIVAMAMSFVPASYTAYIVRERQDQVKHLQMVSGVSNIAYWAANGFWDVCSFILPFLLTVIILFSFNIEAFETSSGTAMVIVSLWLFVLSAIPFTYSLSFLFDTHIVAQNVTLLFNFITSNILLVLTFALSMISSTHKVSNGLRFVFRLFPGFLIGDTFLQLLTFKTQHPLKTVWDMEICGWNLVFFFIDFFLYTGVLILFEHWSSNNTWEWIRGGCTSISATDDDKFKDPEEDADVALLRHKIEKGDCDDSETYPIVLKGLRKVYPAQERGQEPFMAVSNVFLSVKKGQTLGFLGANGAGKSTTMKLLTSEIYPSEGSGDAILGGFSLLHQSEKIRHALGYVPQFDALLPLLTARQHLHLYASIKCVPDDKIDGFVNFMLHKLGLIHLADRPAGTFSGGNKRKLSLGIAIIGNPLILLLDEVSSGVDPSSRRALFKLVSSMTKCAVILVSHSMEELESLSSHIAIFASGRVRAYGTSLHLKQRHGNGLQIELQCTDGQQDHIHQWFESQFPKDLIVVEQHRVTLKYAIPKEHYNMTEVFRIMEQVKHSGIGIESYSVSETSLDQIFIKFIKQDDERRSKHDGQRT